MCYHKFLLFFEKSIQGFFLFTLYQQMSTEILQNLPKKFVCNFCDYNTNNKKDFSKHLSTDKHKKRDKSTKIKTLATKFYFSVCFYVSFHYLFKAGFISFFFIIANIQKSFLFFFGFVLLISFVLSFYFVLFLNKVK